MTSVVRAQAVVLGATEVMGPPTPLASTGARAARSRSCSSPEPIDHEEHDLLGSGYRVGKPSGYRRAARVGQLAEQGRHDTMQARATPVGQDRIGLVSGLRPLVSGQRHCRLGRFAVSHEGTPYDPRTPSTHERAGRITSREGFHAG